MRRGVISHADSVRDIRGFRSEGVFVTLTFDPTVDPSPRQVSRYIDQTLKYAARRGEKLAYEWVIELHASGRPHYHVLWWVPKGFRLPKPDDSGHWPHGLSRIELATRPVGYLVKYVSKGTDDKPMPRGVRLFGTGGERDAAFARHRATLPKWLDDEAAPSERLLRVPFVGWVERGSGAVHHSPFLMAFEVGPSGVVCICTRVR